MLMSREVYSIFIHSNFFKWIDQSELVYNIFLGKERDYFVEAKFFEWLHLNPYEITNVAQIFFERIFVQYLGKGMSLRVRELRNVTRT